MSRKLLDKNRVYTDLGSLQHGMWRETKVGKKVEKLVDLELPNIPGKADFQEGMNHFWTEQRAQALPHFEKSAQHRYPPAYLFLYYMYNQGFGVRRDVLELGKFLGLVVRHKQWFHDQAKTDNPEAQFYLGWNYEWVECNPHQAAVWYTKAANGGHAGAQVSIAVCYQLGTGVDKDSKIAETWYMEAAEQGNIIAQIHLGKCYEHGIDHGLRVCRNEKQMAFYYKKAADQRSAFAQLSIGCCYLNGLGVIEDKKLAIFYFQKAANQGNVDAQINLARCYQQGIGVDKDMKLAVTWLQAAAKQGDSDAEAKLGWCYENGEGIAKDKEQAKSYYKKAALKNHSHAQSYLLNLLERERAAPPQHEIEEKEFAIKVDQSAADEKNPESPQSPVVYSQEEKKEVMWHQQKANLGDARSQTQLGWYYQEGIGIPRDEKKAVNLYQTAAAQGNSDAQNNLGWCYQYGIGIGVDLNMAIFYYEKAANQENALAQCNLGRCYQTGAGVEKDIKKAFEYFKKAAGQGYINAQIILGWCYETGAGVAENKQEAEKWYQRAASINNAFASATAGLKKKPTVPPSVAGNSNNVFNNRVRLSSTAPVSSWRSRCQI